MKLTKQNYSLAFGMFFTAGTVTFLNVLMNYPQETGLQLGFGYIGFAVLIYVAYKSDKTLNTEA